MPLFALIAITMVAFAANSVLTRVGIFTHGMDPFMFSGLRLAAGAAMLTALLVWRGGGWPRPDRGRMMTAGALLLYLLPFSFAYMTLPSGLGALILFGVVQLTMFAGAALSGTRPRARDWFGMALAMGGLAWLLAPSGEGAPQAAGVIAMVLAGVGWGVFSLRGRGSRDPLADMGLSFVLLLPVSAVLMVAGQGWSVPAVLTAVVCGAVTSGLGYALWYRVLPQIAATTGAVAQLSVPVIAIVAGALLLAEALTLQLMLGSAIVLSGIALAVVKR